MGTEILVPFESEPVGPNVEHLIRISCFNDQENYCYNGPFKFYDPSCNVYIPLSGPAVSSVGPGIFGFTETKGLYFRTVMEKPQYIKKKFGLTLKFKYQVFAALKSELSVDSGNMLIKSFWPEIHPNEEGDFFMGIPEEPYSFAADRVWICNSFDSLDKAKFFHFMKRKVQLANYGETNGK